MTDREKQIEEITTIIDSVLGSSPTLVLQSRVNGGKYKSIKNSEIAEELYNANYRKMDEVTLKLDLGDRSAEEIQQIAEAFNKAMANEQTFVAVPNDDLKNEIINLKCEHNDWKQRAESAEERYDSLIQLSIECTSKKIQNILQDLYNHARHGTQDNDNGFVLACNLMKTKILAKAKQYGVEIEK